MSLVPYPSANNDPTLMIQKIDALYTSLADDTSPEYQFYHNHTLDNNLIATTPLHDAAAAGETLLAMEIATLKPSFARKLNREGLSPMHLALLNRHIETVRSLLAIEPELVRVKGKYRKTPLHYAAEMDETEVLAEFLMYCPSAIKDLSSSCDSALHSAVKRRNVGACKVILGWLQKVQVSDLYKVINWKDVNGNNVLHIAISTNQPEVLRMFIPYVSVYSKNLQGKSCVDHHDKQVKKILRGGRRSLNIDLKELSHAEDLSRGINSRTRRFAAKFDQLYGRAVPMDLRNIYFVVTGLIVSVTYQAIISTPQLQGQLDPTTASAPSPSPIRSALPSISTVFLAGNTFAFFSSLTSMINLVRRLPRPWSSLLALSFWSLAIGYFCLFHQNRRISMEMSPVGVPSTFTLVLWSFGLLYMLLACFRWIRTTYIPPTGYIRKL